MGSPAWRTRFGFTLPQFLLALTIILSHIAMTMRASGQEPTAAGRFSLRGDPRLQVRVALQGKHPPLSVVLSRLERATGLRLALDEGLADHEPDLGHLQVKNAPAWSIMELVAEKKLEGGRWEKTDAGYRLLGKSTVPRLASANPWTGRGAVILGILLTAAAFHVGVSVLALWRGRSKPVAA